MAKKSIKPETYKYKYLGSTEVTLPQFCLTVKKGDTIEVPDTIYNPKFKLIEDEENAE